MHVLIGFQPHFWTLLVADQSLPGNCNRAQIAPILGPLDGGAE